MGRGCGGEGDPHHDNTGPQRGSRRAPARKRPIWESARVDGRCRGDDADIRMSPLVITLRSLAALLLLAAPVWAQVGGPPGEVPADLAALVGRVVSVEPAKAKLGGTVVVKVEVDVPEGGTSTRSSPARRGSPPRSRSRAGRSGSARASRSRNRATTRRRTRTAWSRNTTFTRGPRRSRCRWW